ncbi:MAG: diaminopimelate epimerase [Alphaproteobacteria bacterium]
MKFRKMHGLGNDFVILDQKQIKNGMLTNAQIRHICDRHRGVGCDLLTVLEPSNNADIFARFYNADSSESDACGNATRCVADIVMREQRSEACTIETGGGVLACRRAENDMVTVDMGAPLTPPLPLGEGNEASLPQEVIDAVGEGITVNMSNPHCVFFVDNVEDIPVEELGPKVENNPMFPNRTNVEFVQVLGEGKLRQRTWERGCGITLACGSGACAVAVAGAHTGKTGRKVEIELDGGSIFIEWDEDDHVLMTGPYTYVFDGSLKNI